MSTLAKAFFHAISGIIYALKNERNLKIHCFATVIVALLAWWLQLDRYELIVLTLTVAGVIMVELINTAIESVVDLISPQPHPLAKAAKDVAAGAVLVASVAALVVGYLLFVGRLWR